MLLSKKAEKKILIIRTKVMQGSRAPWKSLNFKIQGLENCSRCWKVLEYWCYLCPTQILKDLKGANIGRPSGQNCSCCGRTKKDTYSRLLLSLKGVLEKWEMCPWKVLEFFLQKRARTLVIKSLAHLQETWAYLPSRSKTAGGSEGA